MNAKVSIFSKFLSGGVLGIVRLGVGFVRVKYLALLIGVSGIGLVAQANQYYLFLLSIVTLSMATGLINRIRAPDRIHNLEARAETQGTALVTILFLVAMISALLLVFRDEFIQFGFRDNLTFFQYLPALIGLPFSALASGYFEGIFFSRDRYDLYIKASCWSSVFELFVYLIFVYKFGFQGALISLGLSGAILFLSFAWHLKFLNENFSTLISFRFSWRELREILRYCVTVLFGAGFGYLITLWIRGDILEHFGTAGNGTLQPVVALSAYALPLITNGIWGHLHPHGSAHGDTLDGRKELAKVLQLVMLLSAAAAIGLITFSKPIILFAYSKDFLPAQEFFSYHFLGDYFYYFFYTLAAYYLSTSRLYGYILIWFAYFVLFFIFFKMLAPEYQLRAFCYGHLLASILLGSSALIWMFVKQIFSRSLAVSLGVCSSLMLLCVCLNLFCTQGIINMVVGGFSLFYLAFQIKKLQRI